MAAFFATLIGVALQLIFRWKPDEWGAIGTFAAVVVALGQSAIARSDARRAIAENDRQHRLDIRRLKQHHRESLDQAKKLHEQELARAETRHEQILGSEHVRQQITVISDVVREIGALMVPVGELCDALEAISKFAGKALAPQAEARLLERSSAAYVAWAGHLLAFDAKVLAADMVVTDREIRQVIQRIQQRESALSDLIHREQRVITAEHRAGEVSAIREAFGDLAKLRNEARQAVVEHLRTRLPQR
ncbi:hypothetical protein [Mycobacterium sp. 852002-40037_SCH5390672]|uniref:hypothetical protein n=1 Tax=Mycobacterium sp. 852002-40037_SCH5390672 TaxID=1834089 RepID=UPI0012E90B74|nr:hypothetical protein [Mycobacterium sp. 852002-40037_SCH5390672]